MSKQLAISTAASIFMMAAYVLFGGDTVRQPLGFDSAPVQESSVRIAAPELPEAASLLPSLR